MYLRRLKKITVYNDGSENSVTALVCKAFLADFCKSPLRNGTTSTAARRTKKKTIFMRFARTTGGT